MELLVPQLGFLFWLLVLDVIIVALALASVMKNDYQGGNNEKWMWIVLILVMPFIGSIIYFLIGSQRRLSK